MEVSQHPMQYNSSSEEEELKCVQTSGRQAPEAATPVARLHLSSTCPEEQRPPQQASRSKEAQALQQRSLAQLGPGELPKDRRQLLPLWGIFARCWEMMRVIPTTVDISIRGTQGPSRAPAIHYSSRYLEQNQYRHGYLPMNA